MCYHQTLVKNFKNMNNCLQLSGLMFNDQQVRICSKVCNLACLKLNIWSENVAKICTNYHK